MLIRTLITFYEIPATALVAELTDNYDERTKLMSFRYFFAWWGGLTMAVLNYLVFLPEEKGGLEYIQGWQNYGLTASIIIFISIFVSAAGTHRHIPQFKAAATQNSIQFSENGRRTQRNPFEPLLLCAVYLGLVYGGGVRRFNLAQHLFFTPLLGTHQQSNWLHEPALLFICADRVGGCALDLNQTR